jgi:hypothetical protein
LRDHAGCSRRNCDLRPGRDLNRFNVATGAEFGVFVHIFLRYYLNCRRLSCRCKLFKLTMPLYRHGHPERSRGIPLQYLKGYAAGSFDSAALRSG